MGLMERMMIARSEETSVASMVHMPCAKAVIRVITVGLPWLMMTFVIDVVDVVTTTLISLIAGMSSWRMTQLHVQLIRVTFRLR
jgi:hypothetical protein